MAKIVFISRSKPETDPRFQYLSKLIKSCRPEADSVYLTQHVPGSGMPTRRSWVRRIYALFQILLSEKVDLIIYNDTDFKPFMLIFRIIFGTQYLYDQQENSTQNFIWNGRYAGFRLSTLLWITRLLHRLNGDTLHLVAERVYVRELNLQKKTNLFLLENLWFNRLHIQLAKSVQERPFSPLENFLVAGTLGPHYGTLDAIRWHQDQVRKGVRQTVTICGFAPWPAFRQMLVDEIEGDSTIQVVGSLTRPQPPEAIYAAMQQTDCLLLPYHINGSTRNRIPSKLREALALGTTVAITANPAWERILASAPGKNFLLEKKSEMWIFRPVESTLCPENPADLEAQSVRLLEGLRRVFGA